MIDDGAHRLAEAHRDHSRARRSARQLLSADLRPQTVLEALGGTIGYVGAIRTMRELLAEDREAARRRTVEGEP